MEEKPETDGGGWEPGTADVDALSARRLLVDWTNEQDHWVRLLARDIVASGAKPSDDAIAVVVEALLAEKNLSTEDASPVPPLVFEASKEAATEALVLIKMSEVGGVNALAAGQVIEFNPSLTVLFGENAAGKTGYARVLKQLAAVRTAEPILPNVHDPGASNNLLARLDYQIGDTVHVLEWQGESGVSPFTHIGIFDSPAVRLHVDDDLSYVFTPSDLALFPILTESIGEVRTQLSAAATVRRPSANTFLPRFTRGTAAFALIETLGSASDLERLRTLAAVSSDEASSLPELENRVAALQGDAAAAQLAVARTRRDIHARLTAAAEMFVSFDAEAYNAAVGAASNAEDEYRRLRAELFGESNGSPGETWQRFIQAGDAYREHLERHHYPEGGDACLYCQQPLGEDAVALLQRYRDFANAEARKRAASARELAGTLARNLASCDVAALGDAAAAQQESDTDDSALVAAKQMLQLVAPQREAASGTTAVDWGGVTDTAREVREGSAARKQAAESLVNDLTAKAGQRAEALAGATAALNELKDRLELKRLLPTIETYVADARWAEQAGQLERRFPALLRSLTETAKIASEQLLNADFEEHFRTECKSLRAPTVALEFPGRAGQAARRKTMSSAARPSAVLSEGEQKVIALADFLAEASMRLSPSPVIFDDPVNSLDYRRIREVAARIAALARERQVVVFTHSIWLATELLSHFESDKDRCAYYGVSDDGAKGVISAGAHPRWDTVSKTRGRINGLIQGAENAEGEVRDALIEQAYSLIRSWSEVVVEMELLQGVTQRYQAHVMMTALSKIKGEHLAVAVSKIVPIFEKACRVMEGHSQPLETLAVRPSLSELKQDWQDLQAARQEYFDAG
jgi:hypothetical protein